MPVASAEPASISPLAVPQIFNYIGYSHALLEPVLMWDFAIHVLLYVTFDSGRVHQEAAHPLGTPLVLLGTSAHMGHCAGQR